MIPVRTKAYNYLIERSDRVVLLHLRIAIKSDNKRHVHRNFTKQAIANIQWGYMGTSMAEEYPIYLARITKRPELGSHNVKQKNDPYAKYMNTTSATAPNLEMRVSLLSVHTYGTQSKQTKTSWPKLPYCI